MKLINIIKALRFISDLYPGINKMYLEYKKQQDQIAELWKKKVYLIGSNNDLENVKAGAYTYIASNTIIHHTVIGRYCSIGPNCVIGYGDHPTDLFTTNSLVYHNYENEIYTEEQVTSMKKIYNSEVIIGHDVWIGANVFVKNGVKINTGAVVGAGAVVIRDVPPYAIVAGVPAKIIKYRFDQEKIDALLKSEWWSLEVNDIAEIKDIIQSGKIELIITKLQELNNNV